MSLSAMSILTAAAISLPQIDAPEMVQHLLRRLRSMDTGPVLVEVVVAPDKDIEDCRLLYFGGSERVGKEICRAIRQEDAAKPGTGPEGQAVYGITTFRMGSTAGPDASQRIDRIPFDAIPTQSEIVVNVVALPGNEERTSAAVLIYVDEKGAVAACNAPTETSELHDIACEQARQHPWPVQMGDGDIAVPYVRSVEVEFVADQESS
jgi:hypothetical protein